MSKFLSKIFGNAGGSVVDKLANVDDEWKDLLKLILMTTIGAYFGGRSYEKGKKNNNG